MSISGRIIKIQNQFGSKIEKIVRQKSKNPGLLSEEIWNIFISADHTPNNKNLRWIVETFLNKGFLWEDIKNGKDSKVFDTLKLFDRLKKKLPDNDRNLLHYHSLAHLYKTISPHIVKSKAEERQEEKQKAYTESKIFLDQNGLKIVSPQTEYAAKWWGRGTQWCTSAEKNNMFEDYNERGPLLIIITPEGRKFQAWKQIELNDDSVLDEYDDEIQFMDEADDVISDFDLNENWKYLKGVIYYLNDISFFPDFALTKQLKYDMCKENIQNFDMFTQYEDKDIDDDFIYNLAEESPSFVHHLYSRNSNKFYAYLESEDFMKHCIKARTENCSYMFNMRHNRRNDFLFEYLSENYELKDFYRHLPGMYKTEDMAKQVIQTNPEQIKYVPIEHRTHEMSCHVFENDIDNFRYVNLSVMNKEQLIYYLDNIAEHNQVPTDPINPDIVDDELADKLTSNGFMFFSQLPEKYKTYDRYMNIAKKHGATIRFFPEDIIDQNIVKIAIKSSPKAYDALPEYWQTEKNKNLMDSLYGIQVITTEKAGMTEQQKYDLIIHNNPSRIIDIPVENQTEDLWRFVANYNMSALNRLPEKFRNMDFIRSLDYSRHNMLKFTQKIIQNIPSEDIKNIIKTNGLHIIDLTQEEQTPELCELALESNPETVFSLINVSEKTRFYYMNKFLNEDPMNFFKLPQEYQTEDVFRLIKKDYEVIHHINENNLYYLRNCLTIEEKDEYGAYPYKIQDTYNAIQKCVDQYSSEEKQLNPEWEKEKKQRYVNIKTIYH